MNRVVKVLGDPSLAVSLLNAQLRLRGLAVVPLSVRLRGRASVEGKGRVEIGRGVTLIGTVTPIELLAHHGALIRIGAHTMLNYGVSISARSNVTVGANCLIGHYVLILDNDEHDIVERNLLPPSQDVVLEDNVWVGSHSIILPGTRIGEGTVVGAGSVVTKSIPAWCVAAGNPARIVRSLRAPPPDPGVGDGAGA